MAEIVDDSRNQSIQFSTWNFLFLFVGIFILRKTVVFLFKHKKLCDSTSKLPCVRSNFFLGNLFYIRSILRAKLHVSPNVLLYQTIMGFTKIFQNEGFFSFWLPFQHCVFFFKAETLEPLLTSNTILDKTYEYKLLESWLGLGLLTSTGTKWKKRRKMLTPTFHFRILEEFQPIISEQSQVMIQIMGQLRDLYCPNILDNVTMCALDAIFETALGKNISAQTKNKDSDYVKALHVISNGITYRSIRPWLWNEYIFSLTPIGVKWSNSLKILHNITMNVIRERKASFVLKNDETNADLIGKKRLAFLDVLLEEHFKDPSFTEKDIQEEVDTFTFEGHDTTAVGVSWCLYLLGLHPECQERIFDEIRLIFGDEKDTPITFEHLREMKYLECVIKESQRIYPSVPVIGRELKQDLVINGKLIPAKTQCYMAIAALHQDPKVFPNPEIFDPERFMTESSIHRHPFAYIPFSAGPRNCIGQKFALNEEKTLISNVVRNFKLKSLDPRDKISVSPDMVSNPVPGLRIQLEKRL